MVEFNRKHPYWVRLALVLVISIIAELVLNEIVYLFQKEQYDRAPKTITLVIPAGTAQRIQSGQGDPSLPAEMVFVIGDVLEVKNEDTVSHELGPIWVPPGATGRMVMGQAQNLSYRCSFQPTHYLGLDIRQPTGLGTRLVALFLGAPTVGSLLFLYSLLVFPVHPPVEKTAGKGSKWSF